MLNFPPKGQRNAARGLTRRPRGTDAARNRPHGRRPQAGPKNYARAFETASSNRGGWNGFTTKSLAPSLIDSITLLS